ncbi:PQQ-binding-like beta-propeller repeat protein [Natrinema halophilum]|uniref:PQQ-like beta-propeller repeat protein n=1 Tax=Natrinema halophilum TaxID=1699371 RepID=A0A7D5KIZ3_9EURY|nr:PQQ-binding-like beta-propeller repeat protein [Natrinema halophilum]QLG47538.1 PQQ-binding-like beta-propeller repeat protein [Natrinema halophilum]
MSESAPKNDRAEFRSVSLGKIEPARSRHMWTRSAVHLPETEALVVTGEWDGTVTGRDADTLESRWTADHPGHAVGIASLEASGSGMDSDEQDGRAETIVVGGRGKTGTIAAYDAESGDRRWRYDTADDVGEAVKDTVFYRPYVVALETDRTGLYAAARRYERDGEARRWYSTVYAFDPDGTVRWTYETDASPIALDLDADGDRLAVGYNRCMGDHDTGLVVLETDSGDLAWTWDPGTEGDRRVGDVSIDGESIAVSSHGDKRGYLLGSGGAERWSVDLAVETEIDGETLYAYPNHVFAHNGRIAFVTGNTYAQAGRETGNRHPNEHRIAAFDADGDLVWADDVRGFVHGLATAGGRLVVPCAQNFRVRDPTTHRIRWFDLTSGDGDSERLGGIATAAAVEGGTVAAIEEPVEYHDDGELRGEYALRVGSLE